MIRTLLADPEALKLLTAAMQGISPNAPISTSASLKRAATASDIATPSMKIAAKTVVSPVPSTPRNTLSTAASTAFIPPTIDSLAASSSESIDTLRAKVREVRESSCNFGQNPNRIVDKTPTRASEFNFQTSTLKQASSGRQICEVATVGVVNLLSHLLLVPS